MFTKINFLSQFSCLAIRMPQPRTRMTLNMHGGSWRTICIEHLLFLPHVIALHMAGKAATSSQRQMHSFL